MSGRGIPRRHKLGLLTHRCTVQEPITEQQPTGQVKTVGWRTLYADEPCRFTSTGGTESMRGRQLEANTAALFIVNRLPKYNTSLRVLFGGEVYGITYINPYEGYDRYLELVCKACPK